MSLWLNNTSSQNTPTQDEKLGIHQNTPTQDEHLGIHAQRILSTGHS